MKATEGEAFVMHCEVMQVELTRKRIVDAIESKKQVNVNTMGSIPCEHCGRGKVVYKYFGRTNKHIHARCTTKDCINWME